ncbi:unannotated protein [freshwater metagenome]|uniref:Unannotated protein n=1 Tax=freshwater metagenome TaxID=449393 RepID=A0A6J7RZR1_9ZZZZ
MIDLSGTRIPIPGTSNLRDVGGIATTDGRTIASGRLLRSEVLAHAGAASVHSIWSDVNAEELRALGVLTLIDLRSDTEVERTPSAWTSATGARVVYLPIPEGGEGTDTHYVGQLLSGARTKFDADDMAAFYRECLDRRAGVFATACRIIATADNLPVLVHCSAGKDRTGLLIALILEALGVPRATVVADYTLTGILRPNRVHDFGEMFREAGVSAEVARVLFETPAIAMEAALSHVDDVYGSATDYLVNAGGLLPAELDSMREALLGAAHLGATTTTTPA